MHLTGKDYMSASTIIRAYLKALEVGSFEKVIELFSDNAVVHSPLYGTIEATRFYKDLFSDTSRSKITLKNIFASEDNQEKAACHFSYDWTLKDGTLAPFECVDVFSFTPDMKISELKIIYDTHLIRDAFEKATS